MEHGPEIKTIADFVQGDDYVLSTGQMLTLREVVGPPYTSDDYTLYGSINGMPVIISVDKNRNTLEFNQ